MILVGQATPKINIKPCKRAIKEYVINFKLNDDHFDTATIQALEEDGVCFLII